MKKNSKAALLCRKCTIDRYALLEPQEPPKKLIAKVRRLIRKEYECELCGQDFSLCKC